MISNDKSFAKTYLQSQQLNSTKKYSYRRICFHYWRSLEKCRRGPRSHLRAECHRNLVSCGKTHVKMYMGKCMYGGLYGNVGRPFAHASSLGLPAVLPAGHPANHDALACGKNVSLRVGLKQKVI